MFLEVSSEEDNVSSLDPFDIMEEDNIIPEKPLVFSDKPGIVSEIAENFFFRYFFF